MDENAKKDLARKLKSAFSVAETRAKRVQEIRKAKAEAGPVKDDPDKPNYKKYKFKNKRICNHFQEIEFIYSFKS